MKYLEEKKMEKSKFEPLCMKMAQNQLKPLNNNN